MTDIWDERKKGLEEDYFHRKDRELLEQMRQRLATEERRASARGGLPALSQVRRGTGRDPFSRRHGRSLSWMLRRVA